MPVHVIKKIGKRQRRDSLNAVRPLLAHIRRQCTPHHHTRKVLRFRIREFREKGKDMLVIGKKMELALRLRLIPSGMNCDPQSDM